MCSVFIFGLTLGHYKYPPFQLILDAKSHITNSNNSKKEEPKKFLSCNLQQKTEVINGSHAFIGHAYGSPYKAKFNSYLAKNAQDFIAKNRTNLQTIIFTGDLFSVPSIDKWKRLEKMMNDNLDIFIAPGNHDVLRPDSRDVFELSGFGNQEFPYLEYLDDLPIVIEDSISSSWEVSDAAIDLANDNDSKTVIIARHNMPTTDLLMVANSQAGYTKLDTVEELVKNFNGDKLFFWLIGDGGADPHLPRISCLTFKNHTFLVNGLGDIPGDKFILYNKEEGFYTYEISLSNN
ncbi:metallophosphoesterase [Gammaproteobacteria bacterium]|jgi:hypothetical protein|nr:metallophosphoesterase [Gammaproteobacteria bacterium]